MALHQGMLKHSGSRMQNLLLAEIRAVSQLWGLRIKLGVLSACISAIEQAVVSRLSLKLPTLSQVRGQENAKGAFTGKGAFFAYSVNSG